MRTNIATGLLTLQICAVCWMAPGVSLAATAQLTATADYSVIYFDPLLDRSGSDGGITNTDLFIQGDVLDPFNKAEAHASATYGLLRTYARLDPDDPASPNYSAKGVASFEDFLTITGQNTGETAILVVSYQVTGLLTQPFFVSEVTGFADARGSIFAGSSLTSDEQQGSYAVSGLGGPLVTPVNDLLTVSIPFIVGDEIRLVASLESHAAARDLNVLPEAVDFISDFLSTGRLLPLQINGVIDPVVTSASGTSYSIVPEPGIISLGWIVVAGVAYAARLRLCRAE